MLQADLAVGATADPFEREADRVADEALAGPVDADCANAPPRIQRFGGAPLDETAAAPASVSRALEGPGRPLEPALRHHMEQRLGSDFSRVRVHADAAAEKSARDISAHAYTVGQDVVFGADRYAPDTDEGRRLLAHELTHVVQQSGVNANLARVHRKAAPPSEIEMPAEYAFALDERKRTDKKYARRLGRQDAARLRKSGTLSADDRAEVNAKLRFFEGEALSAYIREVKPALVEVTAEPIEMPAEYAGSVDTPMDVLEAIVNITLGADYFGDVAAPEIHPSHYIDVQKSVTKKEYVDLLWEWYRIKNKWESVPSAKNPDLKIGVTGAIARIRIERAVADTAPIVERVKAAGDPAAARLVSHYQFEVDELTRRAAKEERDEEWAAILATQRKLIEEIHKTPWNQIGSQWEARKEVFLWVASRPNTLSGKQLFQIWFWYWNKESDVAWVEAERIRKKVADADRAAYAANMALFQEGKRDALGLEYQQAADRYDTAQFYLSVHSKLLNWLEDLVDAAGKHFTFQEINDKALEMGEVEAKWGWVRGMGLGVAGVRASMPRPGTALTPPFRQHAPARTAVRPAAKPPARQLTAGTQAGGNVPARQAVGDIIDTPLGPQRIVAVAPNGDLVLQPMIRPPAAAKPPSPQTQPPQTPSSPQVTTPGRKQLPAAPEPVIRAQQRIEVLARKNVIVGMQAKITVSGEPVQVGLRTAKFSEFDKKRAAVLGETGRAAILPQVPQPPKTPARKGSQPSAGFIVQPAPKSRELEVLAWNTSAPEKGHNVSHAERQFINWFEDQDPRWRARVTNVDVVVFGREICDLCAADLKTLQANHPHIKFNWVRGD